MALNLVQKTMKPGCVLFVAFSLCCGYVLSEEGSTAQSDEVKVDPINNITEVSSNDETAAIYDDQPTITNISSLTGLENKNNDSVDNTNGVFLDQNSSSSLPLAERSGSRRLGSSRYKNGRQQVSINDLTLSENVPRHGALMHKTLTKFNKESAQNSGKDNTETDPVLGLDTSDNSFKRKRRIPTGSATPSVQIVILVIGGVLLCVLLTGFIRWRVRGRLNAEKQKANHDNCSNFEDSNCEMDTIYECECEEGSSMLHAKESDFFEEEDGSKFNEIACSHRFDAPLSLMSQTYSAGNHARLVRPKSPKSGRDLSIVRGAKRHSVCRQKYGNKGRYSRHQRKRLENMFIQKLETIPMENSIPTSEDRGISHPLLVMEHADKNGNKETTSGQHPLPIPQQPSSMSRQSSPPQQRGVLSSLLNTWRSLSFNRDWVGKMWQEQHNIRRISDVLRGMSSARSTDSSSCSSRESLASDSDSSMDVGGQTCRFSTIAEVELPGQEPHSPGSQDTVHIIDETDMDIDLVTSEEATSNVAEHSFSNNANITPPGVGTELIDGNLLTARPNTRFLSECPEVSQTGTFPNNWSFGDFQEEPPEYESLLAREANARSTPLRISDEHQRYQRRHSRNWLGERHRPNRYFPSSVRCVGDLTHTDSPSVFTRDEPSPFSQIHRHHNHPMNSEYDESNTVSMTTPTNQHETTLADEQNASVSPYINSSNTATTSPLVAPFVPQEGVLIEQLSDGAQIVYIPPPALPSYHNDTPPPYQK